MSDETPLLACPNCAQLEAQLADKDELIEKLQDGLRVLGEQTEAQLAEARKKYKTDVLEMHAQRSRLAKRLAEQAKEIERLKADNACTQSVMRENDKYLDMINELENSYGQGSFRDGRIREEIDRLRAALAEAQQRQRESDAEIARSLVGKIYTDWHSDDVCEHIAAAILAQPEPGKDP